MTGLLAFKDKIVKYYKKYELYFQYIFKFIIAFLVFWYLNRSMGYFPLLGNLGIMVVLSLVSAIVPSSIFVLIVAIVALLHLYKLSPVMMLLALIIFLVFYLLYLKFAPDHGVLMVILPVLMPLNLHFLVPFIAGMFFTPFTIIPVASAFVIMTLVDGIVEAAEMIDAESIEISSVVEAYQYVIDEVLADQEMLLYAVTFSIMIVLTYIIGRMSFSYSWYVAIGVAAIAGILCLIMGGGALEVELPGVGVLLGVVISAVLAALIQFFHCSLDYRHTEYVQFQDDDYYYYVKAVPKFHFAQEAQTVAQAEKTSSSKGKEHAQAQATAKTKAKGTAASRQETSSAQVDQANVFSRPTSGADVSAGGFDDLSDFYGVGDETKIGKEVTKAVSSVSDDTKVRGASGIDKTKNIIIPEVKQPEMKSKSTVTTTFSRTRGNDAVVSDETKFADSKTKSAVEAKSVSETKFASETKSAATASTKAKTQVDFDFDEDDDGYDDSIEDYGYNDSDDF